MGSWELTGDGEELPDVALLPGEDGEVVAARVRVRVADRGQGGAPGLASQGSGHPEGGCYYWTRRQSSSMYDSDGRSRRHKLQGRGLSLQ